jgi:hypothetical protein
MELNIRRLNDEDYSTLVKWWDAWPKWQAPAKDFLPNLGFIVEKNNIGIVAGYLYTSNSKVGFLEWVISNPEYRESDRKDAITLLIQAIEQVLKDQGFKYAFTMGRNKSLINIHKQLGWTVDEDPSHEIVKIL